MATKTYGAYGYIEYEIMLRAGGRTLKANFSNGSITQQGVLPATYSTANPLVQYLIENHTSYKSGRIVLLNVIGADAEKPKAATKPEEAPKAAEKKVVKVTCLQDAAEYLKCEFGVGSSKLRSKDSIVKIGQENGVEFEGL